MLWLWVGILAGKAIRERQCALEGEACYMNVQGSVQCGGVHTRGADFFDYYN